MEKKTAVEWLAEKYNYVTWMRNRDEISAGLADEWRKHYLDQAKEMERGQIMAAYKNGYRDCTGGEHEADEDIVEEYYNETYGNENELQAASRL